MENLTEMAVKEFVGDSVDFLTKDIEDDMRAAENEVIKRLTANMWDGGDLGRVSMRQIQNLAESGNGFACFQLARYYLFNNEDYNTAVLYIKKGMDVGSEGCCALLGKAFEKGIGVTQDISRAYQIYKTMSDQGNAFATYALADMKFYGKGCKVDKEGAFNMFLGLANEGYPKAMHRVGLMYQRGTGVKMDYNEAFYWYNCAVDHKYQKAYTCLGSMYYMGYGVDCDVKKAVELFERGAKNHDKIAYYMLGKCRYKGLGTKKDVVSAIRLMKKADRYGDREANKYLENVMGYYGSEQMESQSIKDFYQSVF